MEFTKKQIKAAKEVREEVIHGTLNDWKHIYMAGEICMWDEIQQAKENCDSTSQDQALNLAGVMPSHVFLHTHGDGSDGNEWGVLGIYLKHEDALNAANNYEYDSDVETWDVQ